MSKETNKYALPAMPLVNGGLVTPEPSFVTEHQSPRKRKRSGEETAYSLVRDSLSLIAQGDSVRNQVKYFARRGGPDLQNIRGYRPKMPRAGKESKTPSEPSTHRDSQPSDSLGQESNTDTNPASRAPSSNSKKLSPYNGAFAPHVKKYGIYRADNDRSPSNTEHIHQKLQKARTELEPEKFTLERFEAFKRMNASIRTEADAIHKVFPTIMGETSLPSVYEREFNNLDPLAEGTLTKARVDYCEGSEETDIETNVRDQLNIWIMPNKDQMGPCLPNFFVEAKSSFGAEEIAINQLLYHGTLGARAMLKLREYVYNQEAVDNNAYTIGFTYKAAARAPSLLSAYTIHPVKTDDPKREVDFLLILIDYWPLTKDFTSFLEAVKCFRNASELMAEYRQELIKDANRKSAEKVQGLSCSTTVSNEPHLAVETEAQPAHLSENNSLLSQGNEKTTMLGDSQSTDSATEFASCVGDDAEETDGIEASFDRPTTPPVSFGARRTRESPPDDQPSQKNMRRKSILDSA